MLRIGGRHQTLWLHNSVQQQSNISGLLPYRALTSRHSHANQCYSTHTETPHNALSPLQTASHHTRCCSAIVQCCTQRSCILGMNIVHHPQNTSICEPTTHFDIAGGTQKTSHCTSPDETNGTSLLTEDHTHDKRSQCTNACHLKRQESTFQLRQELATTPDTTCHFPETIMQVLVESILSDLMYAYAPTSQ